MRLIISTARSPERWRSTRSRDAGHPLRELGRASLLAERGGRDLEQLTKAICQAPVGHPYQGGGGLAVLTVGYHAPGREAAKRVITTRDRAQANCRALPVRRYATTDLGGSDPSKLRILDRGDVMLRHSSRVIATTQSGSERATDQGNITYGTKPQCTCHFHIARLVRQTGSPVAMPSIAV